MKLSCRSAKDSLDPSILRTAYEQFATEAGLLPAAAAATATTAASASTTDQKSTPAATATGAAATNGDTENARLIALVKAATAIMKVHSAAEAIRMVITSDRIFEDLTLGTYWHAPAATNPNCDICLALANPSRFMQNVIVRRWVPIDVDMEFRGFVVNNTLNALSQYNYVSYFPRLPAMKPALAATIRAFFDTKVRDRLRAIPGYSNYVIDFGVSGAKYDTVWVIELNPFQAATDSALFSFKTESEGVLSKGPFEFRVRTENHPLIKQIWDSNSAQFMKQKKPAATTAAADPPAPAAAGTPPASK